MEIALFSDIHANDVALSTVLDFIKKNTSVKKIWCVGDMIGYGPEPVKTLEIAMNKFDSWVAGNHEEFWLSLFNQEKNGKLDSRKSTIILAEELYHQSGFRKEAIHTLLLHLKALRDSPAACDWLKKCLVSQENQGPQIREVEGLTAVLIHGTFSDPTGGYVEPWDSSPKIASSLFRVNEKMTQYRNENGAVVHIVNGLADRLCKAQEVLKSEKPYLVIFGHAHASGIYHFEDGQARGMLPLGYGIPVSVGNCPMAINPGSLGHPSDEDPRAAFAILDTEKLQVTFYRVPYDLSLVEEKLYELNYPDAMWDEIKNAHLRNPNTQSLEDFYKELQRLAKSRGY